MNANFGLLDPLSVAPPSKKQRKDLLVQRAQTHFALWLDQIGVQQFVAEPYGSAE
jgi:folate-dependent tRNA-U54 methylase TrmFO/GidA